MGEKVSLRVSRPQLVEHCGFATEGLAMFLSCFGEEALLIVTCDGRNWYSCRSKGVNEN